MLDYEIIFADINRLKEYRIDFIKAIEYLYLEVFDDDLQLQGEFVYNKLIQYFESNSAKVYIALYKNEFAGFAWFFHVNDKRIHLNNIVVLPQFQNLGIGSNLLKKVVLYGKKHKFENIELLCYERNKSAREFYFHNHFYTEKRVLVCSCVD